jgi:tetratricopeptide (TPR) repeat protein
LLGLLGEQEAALSAYIQYNREAGDVTRRIDALIKIGDQSRGMGRYQQALDAYNEALLLANERSDSTDRGRVLVGIGLLKMVRGRLDEAVENLQEATALFEKSGDAWQQIRTINRMGVAYAYGGRMDRAISAFAEALHLSRKIGQKDTAVAALNNLGECHQYLFDFEKALAYHKKGLALAQESQLRLIEADILRNMGLELCQLDQCDEGLAALHQALAISEETKHLDNLSNTLYTLAVVEINRQNVATAVQYATRLKEMAQRTDSRNLLATAYYALGLCQQLKGDGAMAEQMWQQTLFLAHEANNRTLLWKTHASLAQIAATEDLGQVHRHIAAEVIRQIAEPIKDADLRGKFLSAPPVQAVLDGT